ncbi:chromate transporter [Anaeropeptidivorans aminofermentans]|jgi:chromate transporter|uniref:chromate transporter n=1 Tax=Anaeropeptidivorans aminofermentans TaxID=2934315 RepID=UPI0020250521|nr:chromate transporter [Anaeropeptidivorans aminofermentans]
MNSNKPKAQKLKELFIIYIKTMLFAFTGGAVTLPLLQEELSKAGLMDREKVLECYALGQSIPGAIAINAGFFIGREIGGWAGAVVAISGTVLPAFFGMLFIALSYDFLMRYQFVTGAINGIRAASVAVIMQIAIDIIKGASKSSFSMSMAIIAFLVSFVFKVSPILVIIGCGAVGIVRVIYNKRKVKA